MIDKDLLAVIKSEFKLSWRGIHGASHWSRVRINGLMLAEKTGARIEVVELFSFLHDSKRISDSSDDEHGLRAAQFAQSLRNSLIHLNDEDFALLDYACRHHSSGLTEADITVQTCWDADRLDLGRVGIRPKAEYLCTDAAKDPTMIDAAYQRSRWQPSHLKSFLSRFRFW